MRVLAKYVSIGARANVHQIVGVIASKSFVETVVKLEALQNFVPTNIRANVVLPLEPQKPAVRYPKEQQQVTYQLAKLGFVFVFIKESHGSTDADKAGIVNRTTHHHILLLTGQNFSWSSKKS